VRISPDIIRATLSPDIVRMMKSVRLKRA
jgi:hypothetical protein